MSAPTGPYETEDQARTDPAVRAVYEAMHAGAVRGAGQDGSERLITDACAAAAVELGAYDARIVRWIAGFEPQSCAVIAGLIARAHAAGRAGRTAGEAGQCGLCGGPAALFPDAKGGPPLWRHLPRPDQVAHFLDSDHGAEPSADGAR